MSTESEAPHVVINDHGATGIFLQRARRYVHLIVRDPHFKLKRVEWHHFDRNYKPLFYLTNGAPNGKPYDLQDCARKFLEYSKSTGGTEAALRYLSNLTKGNTDMSNVENATGNQGEVKPPSPEKIGKALAKASESGAEPAAPSSKKSKSTTKEKPMATKSTAKKASPSKTKEAKPAKKAEPKAKPAAAKKAATNGEARGRPVSFDKEMKIKVVAEDNPRREGSGGHENWKVIKRYDGKTVESYLSAGGGANHLRWDVQHGNVKLVK